MTSIDDQLTERANPWVKAVLWCVDDDRMSVVLQFNPASVTLGRSPGFNSEARIQGDSTMYGPQMPWGGPLSSQGWNRMLPNAFEPSSFGLHDRTPGNYGKLSSSGGHNDSLSMSVIFDTTESDSVLRGLGVNPLFPDMLPAYSRSVLEDVENLYNLTKPILVRDQGPREDPVERPPIVVFLWDKLRFSGAITTFNVVVSAFDKMGVARRATVELGLTGRAYMQAKSGKEVADDVSPVKEIGLLDFYNEIEMSSVMPSMLPVRRFRFT